MLNRKKTSVATTNIASSIAKPPALDSMDPQAHAARCPRRKISANIEAC